MRLSLTFKADSLGAMMPNEVLASICDWGSQDVFCFLK